MTLTRCVCALLVILASAAPLHAQTPELPTSVDVLVLPATGDPVTTAPIATRNTAIGASLNCNLAATGAPAVPLINPGQVEFDDPFTSGRVCHVPLPAAIPDGVNYRAVAVALGASGRSSARSAVAVPPFSISTATGPPAVLTHLGVRPST